MIIPFSTEDEGEDENGDGHGDDNGGLGEGSEGTNNDRLRMMHSLRKGEECSYMAKGAVLPSPEWCSGPRCQGAGNYRCVFSFAALVLGVLFDVT